MHKKICENNNIYVKSAKIIIYKKTKVCYYQGIERRKRGKEMLQTIENVNAAVNNFVWGVPAMVCIIGVGLVLSARTGFIQFRKFGYAIKNSIGRIFTKSEAKEGSITPFQAVCTALAATVGTGNIAGVAGAIAIGGAGAVFWMWVSALLGMCTKFSEVTLAVHYREKNAEGDYVGGPMYYIKNGLGKKWYWMASVYAILGSLTVLGTGNATQVNTITTSIDSALISYNVIDDAQISMVNLVIGIVIAALVAVVLLGGVKRIGTVTEKLVPFMAVFYIILAIGVVVLNADKVPHVFEMIFVGAFNPSAFTGGVVGSMFMTMRRGVSRGIFSNEAGIGTGSIAHACADTKKPVKQGFFGIFEVFIDTIVICSCTAMIMLLVPEKLVAGKEGMDLLQTAMRYHLGEFGVIFIAVTLFLFSFSTFLGILFYARCNVAYLFGDKWCWQTAYKVLALVMLFIGGIATYTFVWDLGDVGIGLMTIFNIAALYLIGGQALDELKAYEESKK